jgi:hypothetical protein
MHRHERGYCRASRLKPAYPGSAQLAVGADDLLDDGADARVVHEPPEGGVVAQGLDVAGHDEPRGGSSACR